MLEGLRKAPSRRQVRLFVGILAVTATCAISLLLFSSRGKEQAASPVPPKEQKNLPADVESVLDAFSFSQTADDVKITISGKKGVRRGRRLLGLRSNLVKTNFIEELKGSYRTARGGADFAASDAEWDGDSSHPLLLKSGVSVTVNGTPVPKVKQAKVHLKRGVIEINTGGESYPINLQ